MIDYMIDYMTEGVSAYLTFIVLWGTLVLLSMNVIERIDNNKKKKK